MAGAEPPLGRGAHHLRQGEADRGQGPDMEEVAAGGAATEAGPVRHTELEHGDRLPGVVAVVGVAGEPA